MQSTLRVPLDPCEISGSARHSAANRTGSADDAAANTTPANDADRADAADHSADHTSSRWVGHGRGLDEPGERDRERRDPAQDRRVRRLP